MHKRKSGKKLFFYDLHGGAFKVQVMADVRYVTLLF
jgi:lysyl-tRNA synthetase, class II